MHGSIVKLEVIPIFLSTQSKKREVVAFLDELQKLLERENFDINTDITLIVNYPPLNFEEI